MVTCRDLGRVLRCGTIFVLCASVVGKAQSSQSAAASSQAAPSLALPPDIKLPVLSPAVTQQSAPGANAQQSPNAQTQPVPISPLSQHVDTPEAPAPQITA